jgi:SAM-dependent methyltransferase
VKKRRPLAENNPTNYLLDITEQPFSSTSSTRGNKPFAAACERNQQPILEVLRRIIRPSDRLLLEVGSGTGQHAAFMAPYFPQLLWQTSDRPQHHAGIRAWLADSPATNLQPPVAYEIGRDTFPVADNGASFDVVFSANTLHIMPWRCVERLIADLGENLLAGRVPCSMGPSITLAATRPNPTQPLIAG